MSLVENINKRRKKGISRPKSKSTISDKAYQDMKNNWEKKRMGDMIKMKKTKKYKMGGGMSMGKDDEKMYRKGGMTAIEKYEKAIAAGLNNKKDARSKFIMRELTKKRDEALDKKKGVRPGKYGVKPATTGVKKPSPQGTAKEEELKKLKKNKKKRYGGSVSYGSGSVRGYSKSYP